MNATLPAQQLTFASITFPKDRKILMVHEVAQMLRVSEQHVLDLIAERKIAAINISGMGADRKFLRIPVEAYEAFKGENCNLNPKVSWE